MSIMIIIEIESQSNWILNKNVGKIKHIDYELLLTLLLQFTRHE